MYKILIPLMLVLSISSCSNKNSGHQQKIDNAFIELDKALQRH